MAAHSQRLRAPAPGAPGAPGANLSAALAEAQSGRLDGLTPAELLRWAVQRFHPRLALSCSFGNPEGLVLLDMLHRIEPRARVWTLDTGRLPQETHDLVDRVRDRYDITVEVVLPDAVAVQQMVQRHGMNLFYESLENRRLCCRLRKVEPNRRFLAGLDGYITGLRREQNITRQNAQRVEVEDGGRMVKINPLVDWRAEQVWDYVREHSVPVNRLHARGYPSVGCAPCSRAVQPGEDPRGGRWWWELPETKECGLHGEEEGIGSGI